jgi:hypothetical protein
MTKSSLSKVALAALCIGTTLICSPAGAVGFGGLFSSIIGQSSGENVNLDETLVKLSDRLNRKMPQTIDADTRLDKVSAEPGHQFAYHLTILSARSSELNTSAFYKSFRPTLQKRVCAAEELKVFFRNRVTVAYAYQGKDGQDIGKLAFSPKDCGYLS